MKKSKKIIKKINKSTATKKRRAFILNKYAKRAKKNRLRWNYKVVKKIDIEANGNKKEIEILFIKRRKESKKRKIKYLIKRYLITESEASAILNSKGNYKAEIKKIEFVKKEKKIKEETKEGEPEYFNPNFTDYLGLVELMEGGRVLPEAEIKCNILGKEFNFLAKDFNIKKIEMRKYLEENSEFTDSPSPVFNEEFKVWVWLNKDWLMRKINFETTGKNLNE